MKIEVTLKLVPFGEQTEARCASSLGAMIGELALEGTLRTIIVETGVMPARNEED